MLGNERVAFALGRSQNRKEESGVGKGLVIGYSRTSTKEKKWEGEEKNWEGK